LQFSQWPRLRPGQKAPGCRVALACSAVMPGALPFVQAALRALGAAHPTSPLFVSSESVALVSGHGGVPPWPSCTRLSRAHSRFCGARPLRPHAALLHNAAFCKVFASRCAKAPLGVAHRCAPSRVRKTGVMQSGLRLGAGASAVGAPRSLARPTRRRPVALVAAVAAGHWSGASRIVLVSGLRPYILCLPPPTLGPRRCAALARRGSARPPPKGAPSAPRAALRAVPGVQAVAK